MLIRSFQSDDSNKCRTLWKELTQHHRDIYQNQSIGGDNPELLFDKQLEKVGGNYIWVAEMDTEVVGMIGLEKINDEFYVEPIIVGPKYQNQGIGKQLIEFIITKAKEMNLKSLSVKSVMRNKQAINFYHASGFNKIAYVELFMILDQKSETKWKSDLQIFNLVFDY